MSLPEQTASLPEQTGFFGHPKGLRTLFFAEFWERFSYYGMRALLILFMSTPIAAGGLGWDVAKAGPLYGLYTSMVYLMSLPGGWIADRILGSRKSVFWGGTLIMLGHVALAIPGVIGTFFLGLALIVMGTGLLKPNISTMVGKLYAPADERRDAGFSIFYMGINLGAMIAPLITSFLAQSDTWKGVLAGWGLDPVSSWHWGFGATAVGMAIGLTVYVLDKRTLGDAGIAPAVTSAPAQSQARQQLWLGVGIVVAALLLLVILNATGVIALSVLGITKGFGAFMTLLVVGFFYWLIWLVNWTPEERKRVVVIAVLFLGAVVFWSLFEQAGSTLTLFADRSTRNEIFGIKFGSGSWQSINSAWVVVLAPTFAWIWIKLGKHNPSSPAKFAFGLFFAALSFAVMVPAAQLAAGGNRVGWWWLMASYFFASVGEMCLSPVGLSAMTKLAPARVASLVMGVWFLATSVGDFIAGVVSGFYEKLSGTTIFGLVALITLAFAVLLAFMVRPIRNMLEREG
ncbi:MAG TPA: peptide MFS transporter [Gemmatimonadales bacterium]|nr:peptide MFS transporter [Gemmatimonadales bacterium]